MQRRCKLKIVGKYEIGIGDLRVGSIKNPYEGLGGLDPTTKILTKTTRRNGVSVNPVS